MFLNCKYFWIAVKLYKLIVASSFQISTCNCTFEFLNLNFFISFHFFHFLLIPANTKTSLCKTTQHTGKHGSEKTRSVETHFTHRVLTALFQYQKLHCIDVASSLGILPSSAGNVEARLQSDVVPTIESVSVLIMLQNRNLIRSEAVAWRCSVEKVFGLKLQ